MSTEAKAAEPTKLTPGMKLWFVPTQRWDGKPRWIEVESVGRKWAKVVGDVNRRIRMDDLGVYGSDDLIGQTYATREEHERLAAAERAWDDLRRTITGRYCKPADVTAEDIEAARKLLRMEAKPKP